MTANDYAQDDFWHMTCSSHSHRLHKGYYYCYGLCRIMALMCVLIMEMSMGYETLTGELGEGLSGRQKQRTYIARAQCHKPK